MQGGRRAVRGIEVIERGEQAACGGGTEAGGQHHHHREQAVAGTGEIAIQIAQGHRVHHGELQ
ncbi:hypothetical protein D3C81_2340440 [compost metagenome]